MRSRRAREADVGYEDRVTGRLCVRRRPSRHRAAARPDVCRARRAAVRRLPRRGIHAAAGRRARGDAWRLVARLGLCRRHADRARGVQHRPRGDPRFARAARPRGGARAPRSPRTAGAQTRALRHRCARTLRLVAAPRGSACRRSRAWASEPCPSQRSRRAGERGELERAPPTSYRRRRRSSVPRAWRMSSGCTRRAARRGEICACVRRCRARPLTPAVLAPTERLRSYAEGAARKELARRRHAGARGGASSARGRRGAAAIAAGGRRPPAAPPPPRRRERCLAEKKLLDRRRARTRERARFARRGGGGAEAPASPAAGAPRLRGRARRRWPGCGRIGLAARRRWRRRPRRRGRGRAGRGAGCAAVRRPPRGVAREATSRRAQLRRAARTSTRPRCSRPRVRRWRSCFSGTRRERRPPPRRHVAGQGERRRLTPARASRRGGRCASPGVGPDSSHRDSTCASAALVLAPAPRRPMPRCGPVARLAPAESGAATQATLGEVAVRLARTFTTPSARCRRRRGAGARAPRARLPVLRLPRAAAQAAHLSSAVSRREGREAPRAASLVR